MFVCFLFFTWAWEGGLCTCPHVSDTDRIQNAWLDEGEFYMTQHVMQQQQQCSIRTWSARSDVSQIFEIHITRPSPSENPGTWLDETSVSHTFRVNNSNFFSSSGAGWAAVAHFLLETPRFCQNETPPTATTDWTGHILTGLADINLYFNKHI